MTGKNVSSIHEKDFHSQSSFQKDAGGILSANKQSSNPQRLNESFHGRRTKIMVTGGKGMLAYDFSRSQKGRYDIILVDREECDITSLDSIQECLMQHKPDVLLNCAAYTAVDDAEDIGMKQNYEVNTLGTYNLAKATFSYGIGYITISTDYVFDGKNPAGYKTTDLCNPVNAYGMAKYLGERLAFDVNPHAVIIRTSWLYGGDFYSVGNHAGISTDMSNESGEMNHEKRIFKNFVNTMLKLSETHEEVKVVDDQHGKPTSCLDLSAGIARLIYHLENRKTIEHMYHLSGDCGISTSTNSRIMSEVGTWADFAEKIFAKYGKTTKVLRIKSSDFRTKAKRPEWSILL